MMRPALAPVTEMLARDARADAERAVAAVDADASAQLARAGAEAAAILARARADGEAAAERAADAAVAAARRAGRETILAAQRRVYEAVREGALEALARRARSPEVDALLTRLEALARTRLGPDAEVRRLAGARIGVRATAGTRQGELTVERFVDRELAALGERVAELWR